MHQQHRHQHTLEHSGPSTRHIERPDNLADLLVVFESPQQLYQPQYLRKSVETRQSRKLGESSRLA